MTKFAGGFSFDGTFLRYEGRFVARFKYKNPTKNAKAFQKFLSENFTVEEYFEKVSTEFPPLVVLKAKGYVSPNEAVTNA